MSAPLGPPWSPAEIDAFFHGQQQHRCAWGMIAGLVRTRTPEQCEALFNLNKTYLSLPDGAKSVQGLAALMTDHFNAMVGRLVCTTQLWQILQWADCGTSEG